MGQFDPIEPDKPDILGTFLVLGLAFGLIGWWTWPDYKPQFEGWGQRIWKTPPTPKPLTCHPIQTLVEKKQAIVQTGTTIMWGEICS